MKAYLILEDGTIFAGISIGSEQETVSEIVFNTSMTGYLEVFTDPSYAGQAVVMTYPLIGNYGVCLEDAEAKRPWLRGVIVRELSRIPSNFRSGETIQHFLKQHNIPGICNIDTRALTKMLREKGTMNGMITTKEYADVSEPISRIKAYRVRGTVMETTTKTAYTLGGAGKRVALLDLGAKENIARSLVQRGCQVTVYPADTKAEEILAAGPEGIMLSNGPGDPAENVEVIREIRKLYQSDVPIFCLKNHSCHLHAPLCVIFVPNSGYIARYAPFIWHKSPTKCDAHLTKSIFKTHSRQNSDGDAVASIRNFNDAMVQSRRGQTVISVRMEL